jgi:3-oxo-5alpha-steroid 4-dehydrogenase
MESAAVCRFLYPPSGFCSGVMVNQQGERVCDESLYGATVSNAIAAQPGSRAYLIIDSSLLDEIRGQLDQEERLRDKSLGQIVSGEMNALIYRKVTALINLHLNRRRGQSLAELAAKCRMPTDALQQTITDHNSHIALNELDSMGKDRDLLRPIRRPPYYAITCDLASPLYPGPFFTLGGLRVEGPTARVVRDDGTPIPGLLAAGRSAVGVCSRSYVSGLSVADCVFSGRNAGRTAAEAALSSAS